MRKRVFLDVPEHLADDVEINSDSFFGLCSLSVGDDVHRVGVPWFCVSTASAAIKVAVTTLIGCPKLICESFRQLWFQRNAVNDPFMWPHRDFCTNQFQLMF